MIQKGLLGWDSRPEYPEDDEENEDPRLWKYCENCGLELEKFVYQTDVKYNKFTGDKNYNLTVQCPNYPENSRVFWYSDKPLHTHGTIWVGENSYEIRALPF